MNREVIKPQADVPVTVRLDKGPDGQEREGRYGVDYQYTVNNDRGVMWLPKEARDQLVRCGAQAGDEIQIVKSLRGRVAQWSVQVMPDSNELAPPPSNTRQTPAPARPNGYANGHGNGNGHHAGQAQPPRPEATNVSPVAQQLAGCLRAARRCVRRNGSLRENERHGNRIPFRRHSRDGVKCLHRRATERGPEMTTQRAIRSDVRSKEPYRS